MAGRPTNAQKEMRESPDGYCKDSKSQNLSYYHSEALFVTDANKQALSPIRINQFLHG